MRGAQRVPRPERYVKGCCGFPAAPAALPPGKESPRCEMAVPAGRAGHQLWIGGSFPAAAGGWKAGGQAGRQGGSGALRRCGREAAGMASVVLSEAEKLYIVHGVQVPGAGAGRQGAS